MTRSPRRRTPIAMANKDKQNSLISFLLLYGLLFMLWWQFFGSRSVAPPPPPAGTVEQQAQQKEQEARDPNSRISVGDRIKAYQAAINKYQEIYHRDGDKPAALNARYQELRLLDEMSALEKESTAHVAQAESLLKDMEAHLAGKSVTTVVKTGQPPVTIPDVGKDATTRQQEVRAERDRRNRHDPRYVVMDWLVRMTGARPAFSYWFALVLLTVVLKTLLWPVTKKQFQSMRDMQRIAPLVKEVQEKMKGKPADEIQKRVLQVYKENNVNMAGGCLPAVATMVVLIPVFYMIQIYEYQFSKGYFLWVGSEWSHRWPMWFGKNLASFDVPMFFLYLGSTMLYSFLQPKPADPQQAQQQKMMTWMMPIFFGFVMWSNRWSSAFMFYWLAQNVVSLWQQWRLLQHFGPTPAAAAGPDAGGGSGGSAVPAAPLQPMQPGPARNGNGNGRGAPGRPQPKKRKTRPRT
jgi:YidC/Oxa1 family membrane protein insertase